MQAEALYNLVETSMDQFRCLLWGCPSQVLALRAPHDGGPFMISTETLPAIIRGYTRCGLNPKPLQEAPPPSRRAPAPRFALPALRGALPFCRAGPLAPSSGWRWAAARWGLRS